MNSKAPSWQQTGSGNTNGAKKMVIKPFKTQPKIPENYKQDTWEKLAVAVRAVNSKVAVAISKEELYRVSFFLYFLYFYHYHCRKHYSCEQVEATQLLSLFSSVLCMNAVIANCTVYAW